MGMASGNVPISHVWIDPVSCHEGVREGLSRTRICLLAQHCEQWRKNKIQNTQSETKMENSSNNQLLVENLALIEV